MSGHCEHCDPNRIDCRDEGDDIGWTHTQPVAETQYRATWVSGHCPMCAGAAAERERIVTMLHAQSLKVAQTPSTDIACFWVGYISALDDTAAEIARGEQ